MTFIVLNVLSFAKTEYQCYLIKIYTDNPYACLKKPKPKQKTHELF
jgi:hypothetical protein